MEEQGGIEELADPATKTILLVDDDESLLDLIEHLVQKEGFKTVRSMDGLDALKKVDERSPDLIILDFMLPGMGGYEVVRELQSAGHTSIPVVVLTGRHMDRKNIEMVRMEANVKEFMEKPLKPALMSAALHSILKTRPPDINRSPRRGPMSGGIS